MKTSAQLNLQDSNQRGNASQQDNSLAENGSRNGDVRNAMEQLSPAKRWGENSLWSVFRYGIAGGETLEQDHACFCCPLMVVLIESRKSDGDFYRKR